MYPTTNCKKKGRSGRISTSEHRLYDSMKHVGLLQPLVYVKNRDTQEFELFGGGRTRLKLLAAIQSEHAKTRETPVAAPAIFRNETKFPQEIEVSHLIQNHIQRRRKFIDQALHLNDCVETRLEEIGRKMSQRETVSWLRQSGFPISQSLLSDMQFTATRLYPLLPTALCNGLGRRHVVNIRKLYRAMRETWKSFGDDLNDCHEAFEDICGECDDEIFDIELFREVMEREVCLWCDLNSQYVRAMLLVNREERVRLIDALAKSDRKGVPISHSKPLPIQSNTANTKLGAQTSKRSQFFFDLPPAVSNRRKRYARRLALDLAKSAGILEQVSGSIANAIGYSIQYPPRSATSTVEVLWQCLYYCQKTPLSTNLNNQRLGWEWRSLDPKEFSNVLSLVEVTRTLCSSRSVAKTSSQLEKAA